MSTIPTPLSAEWRAIPGYKGYFATDTGLISQKNNMEPLRPIKSHGYLIAPLTIDGQSRKVRVHRLVALAFLGPCPKSGYQVNHKNLDTSDNRVENLEWSDPKQNMRHFFDELKKNGAKLMPQKVGAYNPSTEEFQQWPSMGQAAKFFGVKDSTMCGNMIDYGMGSKLYKGWYLYKLDDDWNPCDSLYPMKKMLQVKAFAKTANVA